MPTFPPPDYLTPKAAGAILRARRKARGLRQEDVAEQAGMSSKFLSAFENGHYSIANSQYFGPLTRILGLSEEEVRKIKLDAFITVEMPSEPTVPHFTPYSGFEDLPITPESRARGKLLTQARHRAGYGPIQAHQVSGIHPALIQALEAGHDVTESLTIKDARALHKAFGLSQSAFSEIMDLQIVKPSGLSKSLRAVAKALFADEE